MAKTFSQFFKFLMIGAVNTIIDWGLLNILLLTSQRTDSLAYIGFKSLSFSLAVVNSYFLNKHWTFRDKGDSGAGQAGLSAQAGKFILVNLIGLVINIGLASLVARNGYGRADFIIWANIGAVMATGASLLWNFLGYKFFVFKK